MNEQRRQQVELLEDYFTALERDPAARRPDGLDEEMAEVVDRLESALRPPEPEPAFATELHSRLQAQAARLAAEGGRQAPTEGGWLRLLPAFRRPWALSGLAATLLVVMIAGYLALMRLASVSAEEIVRKAQEVAASPAAAGVRSFISTETRTARPGNPRLNGYSGLTGDEQIRSETKRWYQAPDLWRTEDSGNWLDGSGNPMPGRAWKWIAVGDGREVWRYDAVANTATVHDVQTSSGKSVSYGGESPLGQGAMDPERALQASNPNVRPKLQGEEVVAGRKAYVLAFPTGTPSASAPEMNGPRTVWIDKESYFVLKIVQTSGTDGKWLSTDEVTSIQYNVAIDPTMFTFTPPAGAKIDDQRPKPAPTKGEFQQQMEEIARQAGFPVFLPGRVPDGLVPRQPRADDALGLQVEYVPPAEAEKDSFATMILRQQKATQSMVSAWTEGAESLDVGGTKGWLRRGTRNVDGTGSDSAAMLLRDGTLISVSSFTLPPEELVQVAASLAPVPGGHAPLPNPTPPSLGEIRQRASFKLFLPGYIPVGVTPEPPVAGSNQGSDRIDALNVTYHSADGAVALKLVEGPPRDPSGMAPPALRAPEVTIRPGITGRLEDYKDPTLEMRHLWWEQEGTYIALETRVLSREELLKVAASMSPTAELGKTEPVVGRPTPTPIPAPAITVLRPTWLPEPATAREQYEPGPTGKGSQIVIGFDPRPEDTKPHGVLTLTEVAKQEAGDRSVNDPEAIRETIGEREVTIIMRGEDWITLMWEQGDVALTLTNPYDPPGHPRYTPDQLRRVVESIKHR